MAYDAVWRIPAKSGHNSAVGVDDRVFLALLSTLNNAYEFIKSV
jgi:hypothetical protein